MSIFLSALRVVERQGRLPGELELRQQPGEPDGPAAQGGVNPVQLLKQGRIHRLRLLPAWTVCRKFSALSHDIWRVYHIQGGNTIRFAFFSGARYNVIQFNVVKEQSLC